MGSLKAVIYIRVSDESQILNNSLDTQLKTCRDYAESNGYEVVKVFREEGVSAKHVQTRPAMRDLLACCTLKKNQISAVIIYKMDRWSRNTSEGLIAINLLAKYGCNIVPATEIADQSPMGKAMRTILMAVGEMDNDTKGLRVKDNMQSMFRKGLWCWKPRIGYKRPYKTKEESKGKPVVFDGRLAEIIRLMFLKAAETTISKKALADHANRLGFKEIYGKEADGKLAASIISDTFYYGYMYAPKWQEYSWGKHEALVDQITSERANVNLFGRTKKYKHQDNNIYPLKGFLQCSGCSNPMTSSNPRGTSKSYLYYECHNTKCSNKKRIRADKAHEQFSSLLGSIRPSERVLKLFSHLVFSEWDKSIDERKREAEILDEQIRSLENKLTAIAESNSKHILTDEEAQARAVEIRNDITVLRVERVDIRIEQYDTEAVKSFTENFLVNLDKLWLQAELPHKQALQSEIFPNKLRVENGEIRTNGLASTFKLIEELNTENIDLVTRERIELSLAE